MNKLSAKFGADVRNLFLFSLVVIVMVYIWRKIELAKRQYDEQQQRSNRNNPNQINANDQIENNINQNEIKTKSPKIRYFQLKQWKNQSIVISLDTLIKIEWSNLNINFVSINEIEIIKALTSRHRLYMIYQIPLNYYNSLTEQYQTQEFSILEQKIIEKFTQEGLFTNTFQKHKLLFCSNEKGKSAMVRQLLPTLYIDQNENVLKEVAPHITETVQITNMIGGGGVLPEIYVSKSVEDYFK